MKKRCVVRAWKSVRRGEVVAAVTRAPRFGGGVRKRCLAGCWFGSCLMRLSASPRVQGSEQVTARGASGSCGDAWWRRGFMEFADDADGREVSKSQLVTVGVLVVGGI
jgi:hypothetical protein